MPTSPVSPLRRLARRVVGVRHARGVAPRSLRASLALLLGGGLAVTAAAGAGVAVLARVVAGGSLQTADAAAVAWARAHRHPVLDALALVGAALGSGPFIAGALAIGSIAFWRTRHRLSLLLLWCAFLGGRVLSATLKSAFDRPRPRPVAWDVSAFGFPVAFPTSPSFPSGHAVMAVVTVATLAWLVVRLEPTRAQRRLTLLAAGLVILLIGGSRVYLGVHYPSDVVAGYLAGLGWATIAATGVEVARRLRDRDPRVARLEADLERGLQPVVDAARGRDGR